jgi:adenine-specific DNA-methyltransferase
MKYKVDDLGQVFTPEKIVSYMIGLIENEGSILEPSCGDGIFLKFLYPIYDNVIGVELDKDHCPEGAINLDFFDYSIDNKFETIIGNPPYVSGKKILKETLLKIDSKYISHGKSNLYLYFIEKCINHLTDNGEIIFITPREFIKNTSSLKLNEFIYNNGTITHWIEYGEEVVFKGYSPSVVVWRFQKNNFTRKTKTNDGIKNFINSNGQLLFLDNLLSGKKLGDLFQVKVGGVSGLDEVFTEETGNMDFVCSYTGKTGLLKRMHYNIINSYILEKKDILINRKMKKFNESNWWIWGRDFYKSDRKRIYVNSKTRNENPFFIHECKSYDGSILALVPKNDEIEKNLEKYLKKLNSIDWQELGFKVGSRFIFNQKSLESIIIDL